MTAKQGETYADIIKRMKNAVNPSDHGTKILAVRRTQKEDILIVLEKTGNIKSLNEALEKAVGKQAKVSALTRKRLVEIKDIDETVTVEEVLEAVSKIIDVTADQISNSCRVRRGYGGMQTATMLLGEEVAQKLIMAGNIKIGWVNCRIREKPQITRCYRCLGFGHISTACRGPDRSKACYGCGGNGHVVKDCTGKVQCVICKEKNKENNHLLGSNKCTSFISALNNAKKTKHAAISTD